MQKFEGTKISIKLEQGMFEEIDRISARLGQKRAETIRNMLNVALDVFHGYEKIGLVKLYEIQKRAKKAIKEETQPSLFKV